MPDFSLESELHRRAEKEPNGLANTLWHRYEVMKEHLSTNYYPWVQANCPWFTDHGEKHVISVIHASNQLLSCCRAKDFSDLDIFLLLTAIVWHDAGMVTMRSGHANAVKAIIEQIRKLALPDLTAHRLIVELTRAHTGETGLDVPRESQDCSPSPGNTMTVYPRALAAILRFADECSEDRTRISPPLLDKVPLENRIYWEYANCVAASKPDPARNRIVVTLEIQEASAILTFPCPKECQTYAARDGSITLIEFLVYRLQKMNNERAYCGPRLARYASISRIAARICLLRGTERLPGEEEACFADGGLEESRFPNIQIFEPFFAKYPHLRPAGIRGRLPK